MVIILLLSRGAVSPQMGAPEKKYFGMKYIRSVMRQTT